MVPSTRGAGRWQLLLRPDAILPVTLVLAQTRLEACQRVGTDSLPHLRKHLTLRLSVSAVRTQTSLCPTPTPSFLPPQILSSNCLLHELFSVETGLVAQACDSSYFLGLGIGTKSPRPARAPGQFGQVSETLSQSKRWKGHTAPVVACLLRLYL